jgi:hypothetical protein
MKPPTEREAFSQRLLQSLGDVGCSDSPTVVSREFNQRYAGAPVTVHAARKWLVGEAMPTQEKLRVLAEWLYVDVHWLRFGNYEAAPSALPDIDGTAPDDESMRLVAEVNKLGEQHQVIVRQVIRMLARMGQIG